ncbi:MAG: LuxR C-terminal-related transcriptional regulator [Ktedonobacterales bacterium]
MPRIPRHTLIWSKDRRHYELYRQGQLEARFRQANHAALLAWLAETTSFAFRGPSGSLNVYHEARPRGGSYWYAYHTYHGRTCKRYLGRTERISLARLEETARALSDAQKPSSATDQGMTLLATTRLALPHLPNPLVERPRLLAALDRSLSAPLTLLSAADGWGKTTLLSSWASRQKVQIAWLSLDELDNSSTRFWVGVVASLRRCNRYASNVGATALALLQSPQPPPLSASLSTLLDELESKEVGHAPIVLILDDYQEISDPAIHQGLAFWLEHLPAHLHVILSSRVDPDLPLTRLRARGQLTEIRMDDLRFHQEEARLFLSRVLSPTLAPEEVQLLVDRSEGWIAGLQLAALALQKCADRTAFLQSFTGGQRYLLDYVQEEILARLPTGVCDFLLHSAILSRLDAEVCQEVTAEATTEACQRMLSYLERNNLFLVPLDEERRWYRLHNLFREALLAALHTTESAMAPVLHRRAASYYEAHREWSEAIAHRLAGADFSSAARLMEQTVEQFWLHGEAVTMARWVRTLPAGLVLTHTRLVLTVALYLLFSVSQATEEQRANAHREVRHLLAQVEAAMLPQVDGTSRQIVAPNTPSGAAVPSEPPEDGEVDAAEHALLQQRLRLLRMFLAFLEGVASGDHERLSSMRQEIQAELDRDDEAIWQMVPLSCEFVLHYTIWQEAAPLLPLLLDAKERMSRSGSHFATLKVRQWLALTALEAGYLHLAYEESQAAVGLVEQISSYAPLKGYFEVVQAAVLYQWNRLEEARNRLHAVLHDAARWQQLDVLGMGYVYLMQFALAKGDWSEAQQAQHQVEDLVLREHFGTYQDWLPAMQAQWWLAQGQLKVASDWAAGVFFPVEVWDGSTYYAFLVVIRVYFAQHRWREALELLEHWSARLDRPGNVGATITFLAQYMVALHHTGKHEQARKVMARLFALTEPAGYIRVYVDEGEPMRQVLQNFLTQHSTYQQPNEQASYAITTVARKLLTAFSHEHHAPSKSLKAPTLLSLSPILTRREQEVLRLLATGISNQEIARTMVISLATVKKHVSNLLSKLDATSRTHVIVQARARSLL